MVGDELGEYEGVGFAECEVIGVCVGVIEGSVRLGVVIGVGVGFVGWGIGTLVDDVCGLGRVKMGL